MDEVLICIFMITSKTERIFLHIYWLKKNHLTKLCARKKIQWFVHTLVIDHLYFHFWELLFISSDNFFLSIG